MMAATRVAQRQANILIRPIIRSFARALLYEHSKMSPQSDYERAIVDLNRLQSNTQTVALAKYRKPEEILPLFARQLKLAEIDIEELDQLNVVHVSGTKGKGSTCAFVEAALRESGLKTGFYNSPHLVSVTERIRINGAPISQEKFSIYFRQIYQRLDDRTRRSQISMPSYFSFLTILAFHIFFEEKVDCAIVEVGIGGEFDPTNIIRRPVVCGVTTLDFDHTNILGNTIEKIASTKAGIAKPGVPLLTVEQNHAGAIEAIEKRTLSIGAPFHVCKTMGMPRGTQLGIRGSAQLTNAALACNLASKLLLSLNATKYFDTQNDSQRIISTAWHQLPVTFQSALTNCQWAGRCQTIDMGRVKYFLDGAHTRKSMENCLEWFLDSSRSDDPNALRILLINVIGERDRGDVLKPLSRSKSFSKVIFSTNRINEFGDTPKSETFVNIQSAKSEKSMQNLALNFETWRNLTSDGVGCSNIIAVESTQKSIQEIASINTDQKIHVLITGSLHFVGAMMETLKVY